MRNACKGCNTWVWPVHEKATSSHCFILFSSRSKCSMERMSCMWGVLKAHRLLRCFPRSLRKFWNCCAAECLIKSQPSDLDEVNVWMCDWRHGWGQTMLVQLLPTLLTKQKCQKRVCVCSASDKTIANLCFHTSFWWCLVRDLIVLVEIWPSCSFSVASSARRFTFLYPRGSYYCCHTSHKGPKILTKPVAWLLKVIQLVCISLLLQFGSFDSLVRLITLQHV